MVPTANCQVSWASGHFRWALTISVASIRRPRSFSRTTPSFAILDDYSKSQAKEIVPKKPHLVVREKARGGRVGRKFEVFLHLAFRHKYPQRSHGCKEAHLYTLLRPLDSARNPLAESTRACTHLVDRVHDGVQDFILERLQHNGFVANGKLC